MRDLEVLSEGPATVQTATAARRSSRSAMSGDQPHCDLHWRLISL